MRPLVIPELAPALNCGKPDSTVIHTKARGLDVLNSPFLNKGTAFTARERHDLGLTGLLPSDIGTLEMQVRRAYIQYERLPDALSRNVYLSALHDRNDVLFYRLLSEHLREMIPVVNDVTVGLAMEQYHHESRRPRGVYLSIDHMDSMEESFRNLAVGPGAADLILATDAEQIPGLGDWGVGGIEVSIGKLAIYTAAGGIDPARAIPVMLDCGTNRDSLLKDPMYVGNRHPRVRGARYDEFISRYVAIATRLFPGVMLLWQDLEAANARRILTKYGRSLCTFNDEIQGTGAITLAAIISASRVSGTPMRNHRVVIFGAGTAGLGIADQICAAMVMEGRTQAQAIGHFWCVDQHGLLVQGQASKLSGEQLMYARPDSETKGWKQDAPGISLAETVRRVRPSILVGASGVPGSFTEAIIREMSAHVERPLIIPLSNPAPRSEANPVDLLAWSGGRALIATGSTFAPVTYKGVTYVIGQVDNAMLFPGLCLGTIVSKAKVVSEGMFMAAANAVSSLVAVLQPGASLLPHIDDLRSVSLTVASAVVETVEAEGLSDVRLHDIVQEVRDAMWQPAYREIVASE